MAKEKEQKELVQTKSNFTFKGIVDGLDKDNAWKEDTIGKGKSKGKAYRAIRFQLQTSPTNKLSVELFGMEQDYVYPYSKAEKKSKKTEFSKRNNLPKGYHIIGINVGLEQNEAGKNIRKSLVDYDAAEYIWDNLENGDSVTVSGEVAFSTYENSEGTVIDQTKFIIKNIYREKDPINFNDEKFEEVIAFDQEIVFVESEFVKEEGAVYVSGYTIQYGNKFTPAKFVIRPEGNKSIEKTANAFVKKMKGGDFVKVYGVALNKAETVEVDASEVEDDEEDIFGGVKPKGYEKNAITSYTQELRITGADGSTYVKSLYDLDTDFVIEELVEEEVDFGDDDDDSIDFGGDGKVLDISDDDLPF
jgi:single-stranded DNA-binding protein